MLTNVVKEDLHGLEGLHEGQAQSRALSGVLKGLVIVSEANCQVHESLQHDRGELRHALTREEVSNMSFSTHLNSDYVTTQVISSALLQSALDGPGVARKTL